MEKAMSEQKEKINLLHAAKFFAEGKGFGDALDIGQNTLSSLYSVAVVDYEAKRYDKAVRGLRLLVLLDQNNADYWALLGNALKDAGEYGAAIEAWYMAMNIAPKLKTAMVIARVAIAIKDKNWAGEGMILILAHLGDNPKDREDYEKLRIAYEAL
jgi:tetratricopeptide (TPR) repeat protein